MNKESDVEPMTVTIQTAVRLSGLGRTKLYELMSKKEIDSVRIGTRRLIVFASLKARLTKEIDEVGNG
jgi:excisionase family DNA binding protein